MRRDGIFRKEGYYIRSRLQACDGEIVRFDRFLSRIGPENLAYCGLRAAAHAATIYAATTHGRKPPWIKNIGWSSRSCGRSTVPVPRSRRNCTNSAAKRALPCGPCSAQLRHSCWRSTRSAIRKSTHRSPHTANRFLITESRSWQCSAPRSPRRWQPLPAYAWRAAWRVAYGMQVFCDRAHRFFHHVDDEVVDGIDRLRNIAGTGYVDGISKFLVIVTRLT